MESLPGIGVEDPELNLTCKDMRKALWALSRAPEMHQQIRKFVLKHRQVGARVGYRRPHRDVAGCRPGNRYALGCIGIAAGGSECIGIQAPALGIPPDKSYLSGSIVS